MEHPELVKRLFKPGEDILQSLGPLDCQLLHAVLLISGEAGELLDSLKKAIIYRQPIDLVHVREELGDIEFGLEALRQCLNIDRDETIEHNIIKLQTRYGSTYSDKSAQERKDKQ
jgi:NTP pyrophosphatase (non-canonical NTP hydrolase)